MSARVGVRIGPGARLISPTLMTLPILDAMAQEGFEKVLAVHDRHSGLRAFVAIHNTARGPAFGGVRRFAYRDEHDSLMDCMRLARAMTYKCALADLPAGGGKVVVLESGGEDWEGAYRHLGGVVEQLGGTFYTGPDVGTGEEELRWMTSETSYVTDPGEAGPGLLPECTAQGVFFGIAAALRHLDGEEDWAARKIVVQGLGSVGAVLAKLLLHEGAQVLGADLDEERGQSVAADLGLEHLDASTVLDQKCDVLAPCAMGGLVHDLTVDRLDCRIVAGAANNVLARSLHGDELHDRGILLVPDFVLNSGALIRGAHFHLNGRRVDPVEIGRGVGQTVQGILERASEQESPPTRVAVALAEERVASWDLTESTQIP
jgi:leucine dehydrogenase